MPSFLSFMFTLQVDKFLGEEWPQHANWNKVGPWKSSAELKTGFVKGKKCGKCEKFVKESHINCSSLNEGRCENKRKHCSLLIYGHATPSDYM